MKRKKRTIVYTAAFFSLVLAISCRGKTSGADTKSEKFEFGRSTTVRIVFLSTQMNPVEEAGKMRNVILKDFPGTVDFRPNDNSFLLNQIDSIVAEHPIEAVLVGALHGDLDILRQRGILEPLDDVFSSLTDRTFLGALSDLGRSGPNRFFIPWMQASFLMVADRKALPYLPKGAKIDALTYDQFTAWAKAIYEKTGMKAVGFPAGGKGLMHRFLQGYLYPSFTGSTLLKFRTPEAIAMWMEFKDLWEYTNPGSLVYTTMSEPLLAGDVWIAWDHTARLVKALEERPDEYVVFPAPAGPKGRGFMTVLSELAVPKGIVNRRDAEVLIDYLTRPEIQMRTLSQTGFFPVVVEETSTVGIPSHLRRLSAAITAQASAPDALPTLLPPGLGDRGGDYNDLFMLTFAEIVLDGKDIPAVLDANASELQRILIERNAKAWAPDDSEERPARIE